MFNVVFNSWLFKFVSGKENAQSRWKLFIECLFQNGKSKKLFSSYFAVLLSRRERILCKFIKNYLIGMVEEAFELRQCWNWFVKFHCWSFSFLECGITKLLLRQQKKQSGQYINKVFKRQFNSLSRLLKKFFSNDPFSAKPKRSPSCNSTRQIVYSSWIVCRDDEQKSFAISYFYSEGRTMPLCGR